jgi:hypothetical protein
MLKYTLAKATLLQVQVSIQARIQKRPSRKDYNETPLYLLTTTREDRAYTEEVCNICDN